MKLNSLLIIMFLCALISAPGYTQAQQVEIGDAYFSKGDFEKAYIIYKKHEKEIQKVPAMYDKYLTVLDELEKRDEKKGFLKKLVKKHPDNYLYRVDYALTFKNSGEQAAYDKRIQEMIHEVRKSDVLITLFVKALTKRKLHSESINTYLEARAAQKSTDLYTAELITLYKFSGEKKKMITEMMNLLLINEQELTSVQNTLQIELSSEQEKQYLVKSIYSYIEETKKTIYNKLLVWYYIQQKDFVNAFIQERSIDKKENLNGKRLLELGQISMKNRDYESSVKIYGHITQNYPKSYFYVRAKRMLIKSKEEMVKRTYPVDTLAIKSLIQDYDVLLEKSVRANDRVEVIRAKALLYAFYLQDIRHAIELLNKAVTIPRASKNVIAKCKMDLGDIYILNGEPWESTLLYYQVEKDLKDSPEAHQAKLKNAKLSYYRGDFDLAQAHLDVLKLATTREISNDAIDLSLLIQDNTALDTSTTALKSYANIELLIYQKDFKNALSSLDSLIGINGSHSLADEALYLKGDVLQRIGKYEQAAEAFELVLTKYGYDILGDDAIFELAVINERYLKNTEKAMTLYKDILIKYPGSIYTAEARKKYRKLRGDRINN